MEKQMDRRVLRVDKGVLPVDKQVLRVLLVVKRVLESPDEFCNHYEWQDGFCDNDYPELMSYCPKCKSLK